MERATTTLSHAPKGNTTHARVDATLSHLSVAQRAETNQLLPTAAYLARQEVRDRVVSALVQLFQVYCLYQKIRTYKLDKNRRIHNPARNTTSKSSLEESFELVTVTATAL